jgi:DNA-binding transcriptional ArsR family regulator
MTIAATFKAMGDPIRLEMISRLSDGSRYTIGHLTEELGITRQGARKHLQILADVQLVSLQTKGRQIDVVLDRSSLLATKHFISKLEARWDQRLANLRASLEDNESPSSV